MSMISNISSGLSSINKDSHGNIKFGSFDPFGSNDFGTNPYSNLGGSDPYGLNPLGQPNNDMFQPNKPLTNPSLIDTGLGMVTGPSGQTYTKMGNGMLMDSTGNIRFEWELDL